jgi:hypothetical protein
MMADLLGRVAGPARDLLDRVDGALLAAGAPAEHPIWPLLRRVGALPGELVARLADAAPEAVVSAADPLRHTARRYTAEVAATPAPIAWSGPSAEAYRVTWQALGDHLATGTAATAATAGAATAATTRTATAPDSMADRLCATASYMDDVGGWLSRSRNAMAMTLAECLGSREAVRLRTPTPAGGSAQRAHTAAAATIAVAVLRCAADALDAGEQLRSRWAGRLDELAYRPPAGMTAQSSGTLAVGVSLT